MLRPDFSALQTLVLSTLQTERFLSKEIYKYIYIFIYVLIHVFVCFILQSRVALARVIKRYQKISEDIRKCVAHCPIAQCFPWLPLDLGNRTKAALSWRLDDTVSDL